MSMPPYSTARSIRPAASTTIACALVSLVDARGCVRSSSGRTSKFAPIAVQRTKNTLKAIVMTTLPRRGQRRCKIHPIPINRKRLNGGRINARAMLEAIRDAVIVSSVFQGDLDFAGMGVFDFLESVGE